MAAQLPKLEAAQPTQGDYASPLDKGWNRHWQFMDALYAAGYNQVYDWKYMDPEVYVPDAKTGRISVPADTTVVATPCYGADEVPAPANSANGAAGLYVDGDPTSILTAWATDTSGAAGPGVVLGFALGGWPSSAITASNPVNGLVGVGTLYSNQQNWQVWGNRAIGTYSDQLPDGDSFPLGRGRWITRVTGQYTPEELDVSAGDQSNQYGSTSEVLYGGFVHASVTTTSLDSAGVATSSTTPLLPASTDNNPTTFDASFPGYVLAGAALLPQQGGIVGDSLTAYGKQDSCVAFGFRLEDSY